MAINPVTTVRCRHQWRFSNATVEARFLCGPCASFGQNRRSVPCTFHNTLSRFAGARKIVTIGERSRLREERGRAERQRGGKGRPCPSDLATKRLLSRCPDSRSAFDTVDFLNGSPSLHLATGVSEKKGSSLMGRSFSEAAAL